MIKNVDVAVKRGQSGDDKKANMNNRVKLKMNTFVKIINHSNRGSNCSGDDKSFRWPVKKPMFSLFYVIAYYTDAITDFFVSAT